MAMRPDYDWLQYAWTQRGKDGSGSTAGSATEGGPAPVTAAARQVSWWLKHGIGERHLAHRAVRSALAHGAVLLHARCTNRFGPLIDTCRTSLSIITSEGKF